MLCMQLDHLFNCYFTVHFFMHTPVYFDVNPTTNITEKSYPAILDIIKLSRIEEFQVIFDQLQLNGEFYASLACNKLKNGSNVIDCDST